MRTDAIVVYSSGSTVLLYDVVWLQDLLPVLTAIVMTDRVVYAIYGLFISSYFDVNF